FIHVDGVRAPREVLARLDAIAVDLCVEKRPFQAPARFQLRVLLLERFKLGLEHAPRGFRLLPLPQAKELHGMPRVALPGRRLALVEHSDDIPRPVARPHARVQQCGKPEHGEHVPCLLPAAQQGEQLQAIRGERTEAHRQEVMIPAKAESQAYRNSTNRSPPPDRDSASAAASAAVASDITGPPAMNTM